MAASKMVHSNPKCRVGVILGVASIGDAAAPQARFTSPEAATAYLEVFRGRGYRQLDTARTYPVGAGGTSEEMLGKVQGLHDWAVVDSKVWSWESGVHRKEKILSSVDESLQALHLPQLNIEYLHGPDRATRLEETVGAINEAYRAGKFKYFGISNYTAEEVQQIMDMCKRNGWVEPSVYQGLYNVVSRRNEDGLLPILRKHGISFHAYSPTAGGFFTGKVSRASANDTGSRWDGQRRTIKCAMESSQAVATSDELTDDQTFLGQLSANLFWKDEIFEANERLQAAAKEAGLTGQAVALRWLVYHSQLKPEHEDAIVLGASTAEQLHANIDAAEAGPLPENIRSLIEEIWPLVKDVAPAYHF